MHNTQNVVGTLNGSSAVYSAARVIAEWNQNRYAEVQTIDNFNSPEATAGYDLEAFPITSISEVVRPTAGIVYGFTNEAVATSGYSDDPGAKRYYTTDPDSKYKYWVSQTLSASSGGTLVNCGPYITYKTAIWTNKIYIGFENTWSRPVNYDIQISTDTITWTTVASNIVPNTDGSVSIYRQANDTWGTTVNRDFPMQIRGVRLRVYTISKNNSRFSLIELSPRLERDLSEHLISYTVNNELDDTDFISPIGSISSNTGNVVLSNIRTDTNSIGIFNNEDMGNLYYGIIDANVKFTIDLGIQTTAGMEYVRQATMFSETWSGEEDSVSVSLKDASKFLQEIKPLALLMQNVSIGETIWRILDSVGFNSYAYSKQADQSVSRIKYFWTDPSKTVWEQIQSICRTTQSVAYFDEYGIFRIITREAAFDKDKSPVWTLSGDKDIIDLEVDTQYEANKVTITYKPTDLAVDDFGNPLMEIVWQPEGNVVLRSADIMEDMTATQKHFVMSKEDAPLWPYAGMVNVRGELVKYEGKEYRYVDKTGQWKYTVLKTKDDKLKTDNELSSTTQYYRNYFTGKFIVTERGYDVTTPKAHDTNIAGWNTAFWGGPDGIMRSWTGGIKHLPAESVMRLQTNSGFSDNHYYAVRRGNSVDPGNKFFGTRIRFPETGRGKEMSGGLFFWSNSNTGDFYGVELTHTDELNEKNRRATMNELRLIKRVNGVTKNISQTAALLPGTGSGTGAGLPTPIISNKWYDIDLQVEDNGQMSVFLNGRLALRGNDIDATKLSRTNFAGLFTRGFSTVDFEYYYSAMDHPVMDSDLDNSSYLDLIRGGYYSSQAYKDFTYRERTVKVRRGKKTVNQKQKYAARLFDEFGIGIHEIRPYGGASASEVLNDDVKNGRVSSEIVFEKTPVLYSSLFLTNTDQIVLDEYVGNPFGAKFTVANAARWNAVAHGEDAVTFGSENTVDQKMLILGRTIQQKEEKTYEVKNDESIRARGEIQVDISSDWIQDESTAKALGDWIIENWSEPSDSVTVNVFGNPLLQVGDVVSVTYAPKNMNAGTHHYFVTKINHDYDGGLETTLYLRRARI